MKELRQAVGRLLVAGFGGAGIPVELRVLAREFDLGGVILFSRNIESAEQVAELSFEAAALGRAAPAWVSVDQEGGRVARLTSPFTRWPPAATLGRSGDQALAGRFARALASELRAVGITLDYAPVLDVHTNPANPVIGDRALGDQAALVADLGRIIVETMQQHGVAACGKHFPGHGDTRVDSHHELPVVDCPLERLREVELVPFAAAVDASVAMMMTAHVLYPALDDRSPATLSAPIVTGLLRQELGFDGVIVTDDLEMKALAAGTVPDAAVGALEAGCDGVLVCGTDTGRQVAVLEAIVHALEEGRLKRDRLEASLKRHQAAKTRFLGVRQNRPATSAQLRPVLGCAAHVTVAEEMARFL
jgi:beta-N-acetylhexosaminidase